jgi:outer membrane protein OmpA-like peptidoglycan-associated protein
MRPFLLPALTLASALLAISCVGRGASGRSDMGRPYVPPTDRQLQLLLGDFPNPGPNASTAFKDASGSVVAFPGGPSAFADELVAYRPGSPEPIPEGEDPRTALGPPDYVADIWQPPRAVSLGNGGSLTLRFTDNALVDVDGPDLFLFEIGPNPEAVYVDVSADGETWIPVGEAPGGLCAIDIGGRVDPDEVFRYVRLRDVADQGGDSEAWPGADIDAVGAIGSAERVALPSEVLFDFDEAQLGEGAPAVLDRLLAGIRRRAGARVTVEGHTDDQGDAEYNRALSERRAGAVAEYLVSKGVARELITVKGHGEERPVAPNDSEENRRKNRRVEVLIRGQ